MRKKFKNVYRIESARLSTWDYSRAGIYFITICTGGREMYFGNIVNGNMILSDIGIIAHKFWSEIPEHFCFVQLDTFQIMPNHIHGLIQINTNPVSDKNIDFKPTPRRDVACNVSMGTCNVSTDTSLNQRMADISPGEGSLSSVIRSFKSAVTRESRRLLPEFCWQSRFYDSIVFDDRSLNNIRNYIKNNPKKWIRDKLNPNIKGSET